MLSKNKGVCRLEFKYLKIYGRELKEVLTVGIPSGLQSMAFSATNVVITSTVNKLNAMAGYTLGSQVDCIVYHTGNSIALGTMTFVSQNYGAGNLERVKKTLAVSIALSCISSLIVGAFLYLLSEPILSLVSDSSKVIAQAKDKLSIMCFTNWIAAIMDTLAYALRALGKSLTAFFITFFAVCVFRIAWIYVLMNFWPTTTMVYICWPISWTISSVINSVILHIHIKKLVKRTQDVKAQTA